MIAFELLHQLIVDVQPSCRIDDQDVEPEMARLGERTRRANDGIELTSRIVHADTCLRPENRELLDRRGPSHVRGYEQRMVPLTRQPPPDLAAVVVLPDP